jgi:hypothetical protein
MKDTGPRILEAAIRVFGRDGVSGATTREIARWPGSTRSPSSAISKTRTSCSARSSSNLRNATSMSSPTRPLKPPATCAAPCGTSPGPREAPRQRGFRPHLLRRNQPAPETLPPPFCRVGQTGAAKIHRLSSGARKKAAWSARPRPTTAADALTGMLLAGVMRRPPHRIGLQQRALRRNLRGTFPERNRAMSASHGHAHAPVPDGLRPGPRAAEQGWLKWAIVLTASFAAILEVSTSASSTSRSPTCRATSARRSRKSAGSRPATRSPTSSSSRSRRGSACASARSVTSFSRSSPSPSPRSSAASRPTSAMLIIGRVIQGLGGGGLLAKAQALMFETVPREEQAKASTIFSLGVIGGPAIGPALGGYLTDNFGWRWIFFINVPSASSPCSWPPRFSCPDDPRRAKAPHRLARHSLSRPRPGRLSDRARTGPAGRLVFLRLHPAHGAF